MHQSRFISRPRKWLPLIVCCGLLCLAASAAQAADAVALADNTLIRFDTDTPGTWTTFPISGLGAGEDLVGMDIRPATQSLYGLTVDDGHVGRLYTINVNTGAATLTSTLAADPADLTGPYTSLNGTTFGVDFNPVPDRLRVVSNTGQNLRLNVANGLVTTDGQLNPGTPNVAASAYTNSYAGATSTTLYGLDSNSNQLMEQNPPADGTLLLVGATCIDAVYDAFDIVPVFTGSQFESNEAYCVYYNGESRLARVDLTTGALSTGPIIGNGARVQGLALFPIRNNLPPVNTLPTGPLSTNEDVTLPISGISIAASDADSSQITVALSVAAGNLTVSSTTPNGVVASEITGNSTPSVVLTSTLDKINTTLAALSGLVYQPNGNYNGTDTLSVLTNNNTEQGGSQSDSDSASISIVPVNDAPSFAVGNFAVDEDVAVHAQGWATNISAGPKDESEQTVAFTVTNDNNALFTVQPALSADGTLSFTPAPNQNGSAMVTVIATDNGGTANGGQNTSLPKTFTLTVTPVNDAPTAQNQSLSTPEDVPLDLTLSASDVENDALTFAIVSGPSNGTLSGTGATRTYTPNTNFNGSDSFSFKTNDGTTDSNTATITLTVGAIADAPVAVADTATTNEDTPVILQVLANDTDAGTSLTVARVAVTSATHGTVTIIDDGKSVIFVPEADFVGTSIFSYTVSDGALEDTATVTVQVLAVNDAPLARNDRFSTPSRVLGIIAAQGLLVNDSDVEGSALTARLVSGPTKGTLALRADGSFVYTPFASVGGYDFFTYVANDGTSDSNVALVQLTIGAARDRLAASVTIATPRDRSILSNFGVITGLASDTPDASREGAFAASGINRVQVLVVRLSDNFTWNGRAFVQTPTPLPTVLGSVANRPTARTWRLSTAMPSGSDLRPGLYQIVATAIDNAGNRSRVDSFVRIVGATTGS